MSEKTGELSTEVNPLGPHPLWHRTHPVEHLPAYIENVAHALMRQGHSEQSAVAIAVADMNKWQHSTKGHPEVKAAAESTQSEWQHLKAAKQSEAKS